MLFAIDVGNSEIAAGVFEKDRLTTSFRVHTDAHATADELGLIFTDLLRQRDIDKRGIDAVAVSNVVPDLARAIDELSRRYLHCTPLVVGPNVEIGMRVRYDDPHQVGGDRIANAVATKSIHGLPAVIVDFGTATTFDAVSADGDYLGGAIAPGMLVSLEALVAHAARLSRVDLVTPSQAIGRNTTESMQVGLIYGYASLVEGLVGRIKAELGGQATVVATGGLAEMMAPWISCIDTVDVGLTLFGLRLIHELNTREH